MRPAQQLSARCCLCQCFTCAHLGGSMVSPAATTARSRSCALFRFAGRVSCGKGGTFKTTSQVSFQGVDSLGGHLLDTRSQCRKTWHAGRRCTACLHICTASVGMQQVCSTAITPHDALMHGHIMPCVDYRQCRCLPSCPVDSHHHSDASKFTWASLHSSRTSCLKALTMPPSSCSMTTVMPLKASLSVGSSKASASSCTVCLCWSAADWGSDGADWGSDGADWGSDGADWGSDGANWGSECAESAWR